MTKDINLKKIVLEKGWEILKENGRESLRMRDLAAHSNCSIGTLYNLFENLDEIVLLLNIKYLEKMYSSLHNVMKQELQKKTDLHSIFHKLGKTYISFGIKNPWMWKTLFENLAINPLPSWYRTKVQEGLQVIEDMVQKEFNIKKKEAHRIVNFFWAAMHGMTSIILNKKMDVVDETAHEEYLNSYIHHCIRGIIT